MTAEVLDFSRRKTDRRTEEADRENELTDLRLELIARDEEAVTFAIRVENGTRRLLRLIEGGLLPEAHQVGAAMNYDARRLLRQRTDPEGAA